MGALRKIGIGLVAVAAIGWAWWQWEYPTCTFNYRLTVEVETPAGVKSGFADTQVSYSTTLGLPGRFPHDTVTGEATYVDLGDGKNLFVTLTSNGSGRDHEGGALNALRLPLEILGLTRRHGSERDLCRAANAFANRGAVDVPLARLPTTVTFKDLNDPKSVKLVDPREADKVLGPEFQVAAAKIEISDQPRNGTIENTLPWLGTLRGAYLGNATTSIDAPFGLTGMAFKSERQYP